MGQNEAQWPAKWSAQIGTRIRTLRDKAGISAQKLSERCEDLGFAIPRSTIANIESGRKEAIPVHEVAALAAALETSPASLLCPLDEPEQVPVLPNISLNPFEAWAWFSGNFWVHNSYLPRALAPGHAADDFIEIMSTYLQLAELIDTWSLMRHSTKRINQLVLNGGQSELAQSMRDSLSKLEDEMRRSHDYLIGAGLQPPQVSPELAPELAAVMSAPERKVSDA